MWGLTCKQSTFRWLLVSSLLAIGLKLAASSVIEQPRIVIQTKIKWGYDACVLFRPYEPYQQAVGWRWDSVRKQNWTKVEWGQSHDPWHVRKHVRVAFDYFISFINFENFVNIFSKNNHNYNKLHHLEGKHPKAPTRYTFDVPNMIKKELYYKAE